MATESWASEFTAFATDKLSRQMAQITCCVKLLRDDEVWFRSNANTNSIGNLLLHLTGNLRQWMLGGLAGEPVTRARPEEFAQRGPLPAEPLRAELDRVVQRAAALIGRLDAAALVRTYVIQDYTVSGLVAVFHVVEHFCAHTAQIVHITKLLKDVDLSLYDAQGHRTPNATP
jgi:uncharacterized damage-inducible protein DinB